MHHANNWTIKQCSNLTLVKMLKLIRSLYTFYLSHFFIGACITLSCVWLYRSLGNEALALIIWFKIITICIFCYTVNSRKKHQFFYYQNLGISKGLLLGVTFTIDWLIFIASMVITNQLSWSTAWKQMGLSCLLEIEKFLAIFISVVHLERLPVY